MKKSFVSLLVFILCRLSSAHIGILFSDELRGVVYLDKTTAHYKTCTGPFDGTIEKNCPYDPKSVLQIESGVFAKRLHMMHRIKEQFSHWGGEDVVSAELEQTERDIDSGKLDRASLEAANEEKDRLYKILMTMLQVRTDFWNFLVADKNGQEQHTILKARYRSEPVENLMSAFQNVWFDGEKTIWKLGPRVNHFHRAGACGPGWKLVDGRYLMVSGERLARTSIGRQVGDGFEIWSDNTVHPSLYQPGGRWSMHDPTLAKVYRIAAPLNFDARAASPYTPIAVRERGVHWDLASREAAHYVLCQRE